MRVRRKKAMANRFTVASLCVRVLSGTIRPVSDLFRDAEDRAIAANAPLAVRMRPRTIDEIVGQEHFLGPGNDAAADAGGGTPQQRGLPRPAGVRQDDAGPRDRPAVRQRVPRAERRRRRRFGTCGRSSPAPRALLTSSGRRTVLFIDELHRFNRAQQDVLLDDVENGTVLLIGATTENPFFTINSPLLSRSTVFAFEPISEEDMLALLRRALADEHRGLGGYDVRADDEALEHLATDQRRRRPPSPDGFGSRRDESARVRSLAADDEAERGGPIVFDLAVAQESIQAKAVQYDRAGDLHYDAASALIKSMRGSDPDAAVYWLARMLVAGEDPRFVARRIAILASEDIGNADPRALSVAAAAYEITERIGMPECQLTLAQAVVYMATRAEVQRLGEGHLLGNGGCSREAHHRRPQASA